MVELVCLEGSCEPDRNRFWAASAGFDKFWTRLLFLDPAVILISGFNNVTPLIVLGSDTGLWSVLCGASVAAADSFSVFLLTAYHRKQACWVWGMHKISGLGCPYLPMSWSVYSFCEGIKDGLRLSFYCQVWKEEILELRLPDLLKCSNILPFRIMHLLEFSVLTFCQFIDKLHFTIIKWSILSCRNFKIVQQNICVSSLRDVSQVKERQTLQCACRPWKLFPIYYIQRA